MEIQGRTETLERLVQRDSKVHLDSVVLLDNQDRLEIRGQLGVRDRLAAMVCLEWLAASVSMAHRVHNVLLAIQLLPVNNFSSLHTACSGFVIRPLSITLMYCVTVR